MTKLQPLTYSPRTRILSTLYWVLLTLGATACMLLPSCSSAPGAATPAQQFEQFARAAQQMQDVARSLVALWDQLKTERTAVEAARVFLMATDAGGERVIPGMTALPDQRLQRDPMQHDGPGGVTLPNDPSGGPHQPELLPGSPLNVQAPQLMAPNTGPAVPFPTVPTGITLEQAAELLRQWSSQPLNVNVNGVSTPLPR